MRRRAGGGGGKEPTESGAPPFRGGEGKRHWYEEEALVWGFEEI